MILLAGIYYPEGYSFRMRVLDTWLLFGGLLCCLEKIGYFPFLYCVSDAILTCYVEIKLPISRFATLPLRSACPTLGVDRCTVSVKRIVDAFGVLVHEITKTSSKQA